MRNRTYSLLIAGALVAVTWVAGARVANAAEAQSMKLEAGDKFKLGASYYSAGEPGPGVLLLHQCNADRSMWHELAQKLSDSGIHVLTLDYRGSGDSTGPKLGDFESLDRPAQAKMHASDIAVALARFRTMDGVDGSRLATGGASCGGPRSISLASEAAGIKAMLFLSTYLGKPSLEKFRGELANVPILAVTAEGDGKTTASLQAAFELSKHPESRLLLYKGDAHGHPLFTQDPDLQRVILRWFGGMLR